MLRCTYTHAIQGPFTHTFPIKTGQRDSRIKRNGNKLLTRREFRVNESIEPSGAGKRPYCMEDPRVR